MNVSHARVHTPVYVIKGGKEMVWCGAEVLVRDASLDSPQVFCLLSEECLLGSSYQPMNLGFL